MGYDTPRKSSGLQASDVFNSVYQFAEDAEANDTYAITIAGWSSAYATGQVVYFLANTANTGAATLNINGIGAKTIKKQNDQDLATGDIEAGQVVVVAYNADDDVFEMLSTPASLQALAYRATVGTTQIDDEAVTLAKLQHITTARILGRVTTGTGDPEQLTVAQVLTALGISDGTSNLNIDDLTYDIAKPAVSAIGNLGASQEFDWATASVFTGTLDNNPTFTFANPTAGQKVTLILAYTGAQRTITWPTIEWSGGSAPDAPVSGEILVVTLLYDGTNYLGSGALFS